MFSISVGFDKKVSTFCRLPILVLTRPFLQQQSFSIHKGLLQKVTKYFDKLISSEEGQKGMISLKEENSEIFKMFYDWLYTVLALKPIWQISC